MTYQGHVVNGTVVLDEPAPLPEGAEVTVCLFDFSKDYLHKDDIGPSLYEHLEPAIGTARWLPSDASRNVDHSLYGAPRA